MCHYSITRGILWDLDGVLADTQDIHMQGILEAFKAFNFTISYQEIVPLFGTNTEKFFTTFYKGEITPEKTALFVKLQNEFVCEMVKKAPKPISGIDRLVKTFHNMGLKQAIASSSSYEFIQAAVEGLGYYQYFNKLISGFHLPPKPQPHVFLKAAEALNLTPSECLVIEDSPMGVAGAKAAGMKCIAVSTTRPPDALQQADLIIENTLNPPLERIITLINSTYSNE